jgi:hypothetical protein
MKKILEYVDRNLTPLTIGLFAGIIIEAAIIALVAYAHFKK